MTDRTDNPYRSPASNAAACNSAGSWEKRERLVLVMAMYLVAAGGNVIGVLRPEAVLVRLMLPVAMCSIMTYWCVIDSRMRGSPIVHSLHWIMVHPVQECAEGSKGWFSQPQRTPSHTRRNAVLAPTTSILPLLCSRQRVKCHLSAWNREEEVCSASLPNEFPVFRGWPHVRFSRMNQNSGPSLPRLGHE